MNFLVSVKSEILGDSTRAMSYEQIEKFNVCTLQCAKRAKEDGLAHTWGMWTVTPIKEDEV